MKPRDINSCLISHLWNCYLKNVTIIMYHIDFMLVETNKKLVYEFSEI